MQQDQPTRLTDGLNDLSHGMDSSRTPDMILPNSVALGVNTVFRNGLARTRPSFTKGLFAPADLWQTFCSATFQGSGTYTNAQTGESRIIAVAHGRVYSLSPTKHTITDITIPDEAANDFNRWHYFAQAEGFLIISNGKDTALIFDGKTLRRATVDEVPLGTIMTYGQGRLFIVSPDFLRVFSGDLAYGGSTSQVDIASSERILSYSTGSKVVVDQNKVKVVTTKPHKLTVNDTVTISGHSCYPPIDGTWNIFDIGDDYFHIPAKVDSPGLGGIVVKANDGKSDDLLRFTEQRFLNERGMFRLPAPMGKITGLSFYTVQDTGTGQGDLLLFGERGVASLGVAGPRETWLDTTTQRFAMADVGSMSPDSIVQVNGDVFFRAHDGLRSYRNARAEISSLGRAPLSAEMNVILDYDTGYMLNRASAVLFDNRLILTSSPSQPPRIGLAKAPTLFKTLTVLDFHNTARVLMKGPPAYDGVWTGLAVQKLFTMFIDGKERCFAFSHNTGTTETELWEITKSYASGEDTSDTIAAGVVTRHQHPIKAAIETRCFDFQTPFQMKKFMRGDLWLADLLGNTSISVFFRPDSHPRWFWWQGFEVDVDACANGTVVDATHPPLAKDPAISPQLTLGTPPDTQDKDVLNRRVDRGFTFQLRLEWAGRLTLQKAIIYADSLVEQVSGPCPSVLPRSIKKCVNPNPDSPAAGSLLDHTSN